MSDLALTSSDEADLTHAVVTAVADTKGVDPLDLEPLYHAIDPDVLENLIGRNPSSSPRRIQFTAYGCRIVVDARGQVDVEVDEMFQNAVPTAPRPTAGR